MTSLSFYTPPPQAPPPGLDLLPSPSVTHGWLGALDGPAVVGFEAPWRLGGVVVQPAHIVLGLKPWEDAFEGVLSPAHHAPIPWVRFDLEKLIRMALHQSGLALELLGGVTVEPGPVDPHAIAAAAITRGQLGYWRDVTRRGVATPPADALEWLALVRRLLTGCALAQEARFVAWLPELLAQHAPAALVPHVHAALAGEPPDHAACASLLSALWARLDPAAPCALPERPADYAGLEQLLVSERLARRGEG